MKRNLLINAKQFHRRKKKNKNNHCARLKIDSVCSRISGGKKKKRPSQVSNMPSINNSRFRLKIGFRKSFVVERWYEKSCMNNYYIIIGLSWVSGESGEDRYLGQDAKIHIKLWFLSECARSLACAYVNSPHTQTSHTARWINYARIFLSG